MRQFCKTTARISYIHTKHGRILYNMAFNLRRIRCLATQTTAIGFHLMNQAGAFGSIFALWARLKLDVPPSTLPPPRSPFSLSSARLSSLILYLLPATYASMIRPDTGSCNVPIPSSFARLIHRRSRENVFELNYKLEEIDVEAQEEYIFVS